MKKLFIIIAVLLAVSWCEAFLGTDSEKGMHPASHMNQSIPSRPLNPVIPVTPVRVRKADYVINAWGDSITYGINGEGVSYPSVLAKLTGIRTNNFGYPGEDSLEIADHCIRYDSQKNDVMVIQMGDNGGWNDLDDLVRQYQRIIQAAQTDRYIIVTSTDDPDDFDQIWGYTNDYIGLQETPYETALREAFGEHVFCARQYLIQNGLRLNGLPEEYEDRHRARKGNISLKLRNPEWDNTHLNAYGYTALAWGVFEHGAKLGYWK